MTRRLLTREQALRWNPKWSSSDRSVIEQHLNRLSPQTLYMPPSGGYIGCADEGGTNVMVLYRGYLTCQPDGPEPAWDWHELSTYRPHASPTAPPEQDEQVCAKHYIVLPLSGICDECP